MLVEHLEEEEELEVAGDGLQAGAQGGEGQEPGVGCTSPANKDQQTIRNVPALMLSMSQRLIPYSSTH